MVDDSGNNFWLLAFVFQKGCFSSETVEQASSRLCLELADAACQAFDLRRMLLFNSPRSILCRLLATKVRFGSGGLQSTQHIQYCAMGS
jgi:hypothetical protein